MIKEFDSPMLFSGWRLTDVAKSLGHEDLVREAVLKSPNKTGDATLPALIWVLGVEQAFDVYVRQLGYEMWKPDHRTMAMGAVAYALDRWGNFRRVWEPLRTEGYECAVEAAKREIGMTTGDSRLALMLWLMLLEHEDECDAVLLAAKAMEQKCESLSFRVASARLASAFSSVLDFDVLKDIATKKGS